MKPEVLAKRIAHHRAEIQKLEAHLQVRRKHIAESLVQMQLSSVNLHTYATEFASREAVIESHKAILQELQIIEILGGKS